MKFSDAVKIQMEQLGITTKEVISRTKGVHKKYLYGILSGIHENPRKDTIEAIAKALQVSPSVFWLTSAHTAVKCAEKPVTIYGTVHAGMPLQEWEDIQG